MCIKGKQRINFLAFGILFLMLFHFVAWLISPAAAQEPRPAREIGGVTLGENLGGVLDRIYVAAPPNWQFAVGIEPGSFLDCGSGMAIAQTDEDGRDVFPLTCGVTLTETMVIPSASRPAELIIHY